MKGVREGLEPRIKAQAGDKALEFTCRWLDAIGPAPVAFLRQHGRPLRTLEERQEALKKAPRWCGAWLPARSSSF